MLSKIEKTVEIAEGKVIRLETGRMAKQAKGSAIIQMDDSVVLGTMCYGAEKDVDFFPLTVEYREKAYAAGKIPGGYLKREAKPRDEEILCARLIDRPLRPMFPDNFNREVQVIINVISADSKSPSDVLGVSAGSLSVGLSDLPFEQQVAAVRVIKLEDKFIVNPTVEEMEASDLEMILAGTAESVTMVEGGAWEVQEEELVEAIKVGQEAVVKLCKAQQELVDELKIEKMAPPEANINQELFNKVESLVKDKLVETLHIPMVKTNHYPAMEALVKDLLEQFDAEELEENKSEIKGYFKAIQKREMRKMILDEGLRIDGRKSEDVRGIEIQVGVLPSVHGTALFQRGETQSLVAVTLGSKSDEQRVETLFGEVTKNYMLHYNFPPFSVGECKRFGMVSRREIGHGHLAERSLAPVLPHPEDFPYTIRIVSEIMESNGSSSMASVCGGSLSLMDSGVPIKGGVAGIAMGLIAEGEQTAILSDITGTEDHLGDMDFKVAGTEDGITAFQMDIKIKGISAQVMSDALIQARKGRLHILEEMKKVLPESRKELSANAPVIMTFHINQQKIRDIIGPGGNVIRGIQSATGTNVGIDDSGCVTIAAPNKKVGDKAKAMIDEITAEIEVDKVYVGKVKSIVPFGAFVEVLPGKEGLVHISEMAKERVAKVEDIVALGDEINVKCIGVDPKGKVKLSMKALLSE